uniref:Uncharacterized protein n=1 Tax=Rhizophora mucronata TaxID=61149 RepID=A0A2P2M049_RHIMU
MMVGRSLAASRNLKLPLLLLVVTSTMATWKLSGLFEIANNASFSLKNVETI